MLQIFIVPSYDPLANIVPVLLKAIELTELLFFIFSGKIVLFLWKPVSFQIIIYPSDDPLAKTVSF